MKNRYLAAGLCLLIVLLCGVSACGGGGGTTKTTTTATTSPTTTTSGQTTTSAVQTTTSTTSTTAGQSVSDLLGLGLNVNTIKYTLTITSTGQPEVAMTIYKKGNKIRQEISAGDNAAILIMDGDAKTIFTLMPANKMAMEMPFNEAMMAQVNWQSAADILKNNPNITGTETIDGKSCTVISWKDANGSAKYWIWTETGIPLKMEATYGGTTSTMEYSDIDLSDIPDSMFEVPGDYQTITT